MVKELLAYQEADAKLKELEQKLSDSEDRKKAFNAKKFIEDYTESLNKLDDRASELSCAYEEAIKMQNALSDQKKEIVDALELAEDENELNYLVKKVEELISNIKKLSVHANSIAEEIKSILVEFMHTKEKNKKAQLQYKECGEKYNNLKASLQDERNAIESELAVLGQKVDKDLMKKYLEKRKSKMYPVLFKVTYMGKNEICGACRMQLSLSEISKLKKGEIVECSTCGRLLYMDKD